ncbi:MAG TPA: RNA-binding domain-containing protein [Kofleriaceae bacterium]|nr:RNA-binding domain-containing protein [Kofleriaceae bacterium]
MTNEELSEIVIALRGVGTDHIDVEAKASETELPKQLWHSLSAFANTIGGGVIVLGLDERSGFQTVGVQRPKQIQQDLANLCDQMEPPLRAQIRPHVFEGKTVIVAEVPEVDRSQKPCFYKGAGHLNGAYVRVADGNRKLSSYEVQLLIASRGQPRGDESPVETASLSSLDGKRVAGLLKAVRQRSRKLAELRDDVVLRSLKVLVPVDGQIVPSLAGLLALGERPQEFFPALYAQFVVYPTERVGVPDADDVRFVDNRRFEGPIASMVDQLLDGIRHHMSRKTLVRGAKREDAWQYPETALREAVVNALVHRDLGSGARGRPRGDHRACTIPSGSLPAEAAAPQAPLRTCKQLASKHASGKLASM